MRRIASGEWTFLHRLREKEDSARRGGRGDVPAICRIAALACGRGEYPSLIAIRHFRKWMFDA